MEYSEGMEREGGDEQLLVQRLLEKNRVLEEELARTKVSSYQAAS